VEFAITLPVLILLFSGLVEFGFALNFYLSLLDATREAARIYSNGDPLADDGTDIMTFYSDTATRVLYNLDPQLENAAFIGRRIELDASQDDILVTAYAWSENDAGQVTVVRYPTSGTYSLYHRATSRFTNEMIADRFEPGSPNAGILVVEVYYNYRQRLAIPYLEPFVPNPLPMRAYTIMPLSAVEPPE
jgi:Flp pilus assembly protein TadG